MFGKRLVTFIIVLLLALTSCSLGELIGESFDSFQLTQIGVGIVEETPTEYIVSPREYPDSVLVILPKRVDNAIAHEQKLYQLEETKVTEDEIIIRVDGEECKFTHLVDDIFQAKNGVQYQYFIEADD